MNREFDIKKAVIASIIVSSILVIILIGLIVSKTSTSANERKFAEEILSLDNSGQQSESASTQIGKNIEQAKTLEEQGFEKVEVNGDIKVDEEKPNQDTKKQEESISYINESSNSNIQSNENEDKDKDEVEKLNSKKSENEQNKNDEKQEETNETIANIEFEAPVKGEINRGFAKDSLVFSDTLQEWITHTAVDIKADKTTIVKASCNGTVESIKNDPRYGLTVIINHGNGYKTIYANLLTAEFVNKGEEVEKGQTIGTVGNSATFEIEDECHLHFELIKDNEYLDPTIYMNFE